MSGKNEYEEILYDGLFSLIDDLIEPTEDSEINQIMNKNVLVFM